MSTDSRHVSVRIDRPAADVYAFASDPQNLPRWAPGLGSAVEHRDGDWWVTTPEGPARVRFVPQNPFGVLDHEVLTPSGAVVQVPLRVTPDGSGSEVVATVRRQPGMTDDALERDAAAVQSDLGLLRRLLEGGA